MAAATPPHGILSFCPLPCLSSSSSLELEPECDSQELGLLLSQYYDLNCSNAKAKAKPKVAVGGAKGKLRADLAAKPKPHGGKRKSSRSRRADVGAGAASCTRLSADKSSFKDLVHQFTGCPSDRHPSQNDPLHHHPAVQPNAALLASALSESLKTLDAISSYLLQQAASSPDAAMLHTQITQKSKSLALLRHHAHANSAPPPPRADSSGRISPFGSDLCTNIHTHQLVGPPKYTTSHESTIDTSSPSNSSGSSTVSFNGAPTMIATTNSTQQLDHHHQLASLITSSTPPPATSTSIATRGGSNSCTSVGLCMSPTSIGSATTVRKYIGSMMIDEDDELIIHAPSNLHTINHVATNMHEAKDMTSSFTIVGGNQVTKSSYATSHDSTTWPTSAFVDPNSSTNSTFTLDQLPSLTDFEGCSSPSTNQECLMCIKSSCMCCCLPHLGNMGSSSCNNFDLALLGHHSHQIEMLSHEDTTPTFAW